MNRTVKIQPSDPLKEEEKIFLSLLRKLTELQKEKNKRLICFLAAPPAAGKSTLAKKLQRMSEMTEGVTALQAIGMDGFHMYRSVLEKKTTVRDGKRIVLSKIKGSPETFDLELLKKRLKDLSESEYCSWPEYDRSIHDPVEDAVDVRAKIVLLEGNYLLLDKEGFRDLKRYADYSVFIEADEEMLIPRLIARKAGNRGWTSEQIEKFVRNSDVKNIRLCMECRLPADLTLRAADDGTYMKRHHEE